MIGSLPASTTILSAIFAVIVASQSVSAATVLTGAALYSTNSSGAYADDGWNTAGGDGANNLWVSLAGVPINGPLDTNAAISVSLAPGIYNFEIFGEQGHDRSFHGLNLFFGNSASPGISVFAPTSTNVTSTAYSLDSNSKTPNLGFSALVPGAGTDFILADGLKITLTAFRWEYATVQRTNLIGGYTRTPTTPTVDNRGIFTLSVTSVPEPSSLALATIGAAACFALTWRSRRRRSSH